MVTLTVALDFLSTDSSTGNLVNEILNQMGRFQAVKFLPLLPTCFQYLAWRFVPGYEYSVKPPGMAPLQKFRD